MSEAATQAPAAESTFAAAFLGEPSPVVAQEAPLAETPKPEQKAPETPPAATPAAAAVEPSAQQEEPSVEDKYLEAIRGGKAEAPALDDTAKAALKARGVEDIDALLSERGTLAEQVQQFKQKAEQYDSMEKALKELPVEIGKAIEAFRKGEDYTKHLTPLTKGISMSKDAKSIDKQALVDHYFPNKFTQEQIDAIKDGDDTLKEAFDRYAELAAMKHDEGRKGFVDGIAQRTEQSRMFREKQATSIAAAIAHAKADPATAVLMTNDLQGAFEKGSLIDSTFYEADGTPKKESLALLAKALNHDRIVERAMKGAAANGKVEGELIARERAPERPSKAPGEIKQPPQAPRSDGDSDLIRQADAALAAALAG